MQEPLIAHNNNNNNNNKEEEDRDLEDVQHHSSSSSSSSSSFIPSNVNKNRELDKRKGSVSFMRIIGLGYDERWLLIGGTIALIGSSVSGMIVPAIMGRLIQNISQDHDQDALNETCLYLVIFFVISSFFAFIRGALFTLAGERLVARFRVRLFDAVIHSEIAFFDKTQSGELQSRLQNDSSVIQNAATVNISMGLRFAAESIVSIIIIFFISWKLTLIMLSVVPLLSIGARLYGSYMQGLSKDYQDALAGASEVAEEAFGNIRTVRAFCTESQEVIKYNDRIQVSYKFGATRAWGYGLFIGGIGLGAQLAIALVLYYGGTLVIRESGELSAAELTSFLLYTISLAANIAGLAGLYSSLAQAVGASERMFALLDREPEIDTRIDPKNPKLIPHLLDSNNSPIIQFDFVRFTFPARPETEVLKGISFTCYPGTITALVGSSGSGKSTCIALLERFYDPVGGEVRVGGVSLKSIDQRWLHSNVSLVGQEPQLFACSIYDNIAYAARGFRHVTREDVENAAKEANAHDFISAFPDGYDTKVGERGVQVSGGQKQRIAIARALLVNPKILLLDEATSALDNESERIVQSALDNLMLTQKRTTIVVAHRLSTVRNANKIIVLQDGVIVEEGKYTELINRVDGAFAKLYAAQERHRDI